MSEAITTQQATTVDLASVRNASDDEVARVFDPLYRGALERAPSQQLAARGLPFELAEAGAARRWLLVDRAIDVDLEGVSATHLVLLHFCDAWHDRSRRRPDGLPVGWVTPVGEPLASVRIARADGSDVALTLRRRFEVNEGIIGWGSVAFLAVPHLAEAPVDWRGPHARLPAGRHAPPGHTGAMTVLPASWGGNQTGVQDHIPSPTDDLMMWLHAIDVRRDGRAADLRSMTLSPVEPAARPSVVVAALTAFRGAASPLRWGPRRSLRLSGAAGTEIGIDLGLVARRRPIPAPASDGGIDGWGVEPLAMTDDEELEITAAGDATLRVGGRQLPLRDIDAGGAIVGASSVKVHAMPALDRRLHVDVLDGAGAPTPARVRMLAHDGRYLPPLGHRAEVNPGLNEDLGADVIVNGTEYAYVDGSFDIDVPADGAVLEVAGGFHRTPVRHAVAPIDLERGSIEIPFAGTLAPTDGRWVAGDTHVHFLAPSTALLQARAEGVNVVHLLACTWGDHHTSVTDFGGDMVTPDGQHAVWVGSENRQNMLGHIGLVGTKRPLLPFSSGGPPEGPIGAPVTHLMADWLARCREQGGLAIGAHFPLPTAEVAADIAWEQFDALEFETFDHTLQNPTIAGWYRYLAAGYRLPVVGGTDKMTASVPLGQIRTWARLDDDGPVTFEAWAAAVRAGRTFVSSGPMLDLRVDGQGPGATITADPGATLEVTLRAHASQPVVSAVELILDGDVVAAEAAPTPVAELTVRHRLRLEQTGWLGGRSRSPFAIGSGSSTAMAAHTSPVYLECVGRPRRGVDLSEPLAIVDGTRAWLEHLAPISDPAAAEHFRRFLDEGERRLRERDAGA